MYVYDFELRQNVVVLVLLFPENPPVQKTKVTCRSWCDSVKSSKGVDLIMVHLSSCAANFLALLNLLKRKVQDVVNPQLIPKHKH
jgi:hypothetical protein